MKKSITLLCLAIIIGVTGCTESDTSLSVPNDPIITSPAPVSTTMNSETIETIEMIKNQIPSESIEFLNEAFSIYDADIIATDEVGSLTYVHFEGFGYMGFADEYAPSYDSMTAPQYFSFDTNFFMPDKNKNEYSRYERVIIGQEIKGLTVENAHSFFSILNGEWYLSDTFITLSGEIEFIGELHKTPQNEFLPPDTLVFNVRESENEIIPLTYNGYGYYVEWFDDYAVAKPAPKFILSGYNPEDGFPGLFDEIDTINVKATFSGLWLRYTNRATGGNYATLVGIELIE